MGSNAEEMIATGNYGDPAKMVECEKRGTNEANKAMQGGTYNRTTGVFIDIKPFTSWVLDEEKGKWDAPKAKPNDGKLKRWEEKTIDWVDVLVDGKTVNI